MDHFSAWSGKGQHLTSTESPKGFNENLTEGSGTMPLQETTSNVLEEISMISGHCAVLKLDDSDGPQKNKYETWQEFGKI